MKPVDPNALAQLVLRVAKAAKDHRITPGEAETIARQAKLVVMRSADKEAAKCAALDQYQEFSSLRVDPLSGRAKDTLLASARELGGARAALARLETGIPPYGR